MAVPTYKMMMIDPDKALIEIPIIKKMTAINKIVSIPNLLANFGTKGENRANESKAVL